MQNWCLADTILLIFLIMNVLGWILLPVLKRLYDRPLDEQDLARMEEMLNQARKKLAERENQENQENQPKT